MTLSLREKFELAEAWGQAIDYKIDLHLAYLESYQKKAWQESEKIERTYKMAERVADRLAKKLIKAMKI